MHIHCGTRPRSRGGEASALAAAAVVPDATAVVLIAAILRGAVSGIEARTATALVL